MSTLGTRRSVRVPQGFWVGLVAIAVYIALAAVVANLLAEWLHPTDPVAVLALEHFPVLIPLVVAGIVFVRWAGWSRDVWRTSAAFDTRPRRWWMLAIPLLLLINSIVVLISAPASAWQLGPVVIVALAMALVGIGEELYFRGILRASLRAHHGETITFVVTSLLFGLAHTVGSLFLGAPVETIAFQVGATAFSGALLYAAFRATGRLWVPMLLHALDDFSLHLGGDAIGAGADAATQAVGAIGIAQWVLAAVFLISCIRQDLAARRTTHQR